MKNGILRNDEGYSILVDDRPRSFHDIKDVSYGVARNLKAKHPESG